jgi:hypothetical protein
MASYEAKYVVCPFYIRSDQNKIYCEGVNENNTLNLVYEDSNKKRDYSLRYCRNADNYKNCLICQMLNRKYGVDNGI